MKTSFPRIASRALRIAAALAALACMPGCGNRVGVLQTDAHSVPLGAAKSVRVSIDMGPGELKFTGGAVALMDATFEYNVAAWKPRVDYSVRNGEGVLALTQSRASRRMLGDMRNEWDVSLNDSVPLDLRIRIAAGRTRLALGTLSLDKFELKQGAGENNIDLRGYWKKNASVSIDVGAGKTAVTLPENVGARVEVEQGIGEVKSGGLKNDNGAFVNNAYGKSPATVNVAIHHGVGEVDLQQGGAPAIN